MRAHIRVELDAYAEIPDDDVTTEREAENWLAGHMSIVDAAVTNMVYIGRYTWDVDSIDKPGNTDSCIVPKEELREMDDLVAEIGSQSYVTQLSTPKKEN